MDESKISNRDISVLKYIKDHVKEMSVFSYLIAHKSDNHTLNQKIPRHLRRRAASDNPKRLPIKFRNFRENIENNNKVKKKKRLKLSTKEELKKREKGQWLETHIWHAKRFHMILKWGYKIPNFPNDKSFRACYRASRKFCLLQDISYIGCIELNGAEETLIIHLNQLLQPNATETFKAKMFLSGAREGLVYLYELNCYPFGFIGPAKFMWQVKLNEQILRKLWIWCHPSIYMRVVDEISKIFILHINPQSDKLDTNCSPVYVNNDSSIQMKLLKNCLNRFSLRGALSHLILGKTFKPWVFSYEKNFNDVQTNSIFECLKLRKEIIKLQGEKWNYLKEYNSAAEFPQHIILGFIIQDPRQNLPNKKLSINNVYINNNEVFFNKLPVDGFESIYQWSPIWDEAMRNAVSHAYKKSPLVMTSQSDNSAIPVLLVQQPGTEKFSSEFTSGWDLIFPKKWAMVIWISLIYRGARAGGLRECFNMDFEQEKVLFPLLSPDSAAGKEEEIVDSKAYEVQYWKKPPNRRPNFIKLGITSPFHFSWSKLISVFPTCKDSFYVLTDKCILEKLQLLLNKMKFKLQLLEELQNQKIKLAQALVPVAVEMITKGVPKYKAFICAPTSLDLAASSNYCYSEKSKPDSNSENRKIVKKRHQKQLKRNRRLRKHSRKIIEKELSSKQLNNSVHFSQQTHNYISKIVTFDNEMKALWIPSENSVINCSRELMGFVKKGQFSFVSHCGKGVGLCSFSSILKQKEVQINRNGLTVLVRNVHELHYRKASLHILSF